MWIQRSVSRFDTIRAHLSHIRWGLGPLVFFLDSVPFSYSMGKPLAEKLSRFVHESAAFSQKPMQWMELGAGLGLLSKQVLDCLKQSYPETYASLQWVVTDDTKELVDHYKTQGLFADHSNVEFLVENAIAPALKKQTNGVYLSYLLDSIPTVHIHVKDGQLFEVKVSTRLKPDALVCDTSVFPPKLYEKEALLPLFSMKTISPVISKQLIKCLEEEFEDVPLSESSLSADDQTLLKAFAADKKLSDGYFNIVPNLNGWVDAINVSLADDAVILVSDFGYPDTTLIEKPKSLTSSYGGVICHSIFFPYLEWIGQKKGFTSFSTRNEPGTTQIFAMVKGAYSNLSQAFDDTFTELINDHHNDVEKRLKQTASEQYKERFIQAMWADLPPSDQIDYMVLFEFVSACYDNELYELAIDFGLKLPEIFHYVAAPVFFLIGRSYCKLNDLSRAELYLKAALRVAPGYALAYHQLSWICLVQNRFQDYEAYAKAYVFWSHDMHFSDTLVTLSLINIQRKDFDSASAIINWIFEARRFQKLIPDDVFGKAQTIFEHYLKPKEEK